MKRLLSLSVAGVVLAGFGLSPALAQQPAVDSFFDIFAEVTTEDDAACNPCDALMEEIMALQLELDQLTQDLADQNEYLGLLNAAIADIQAELDTQRRELEEMNNPKNFVEDARTGRRYDSSDHAAMRLRSHNLWNAYRSGELTAQEYSDEVGKPFDDPAVQAELEQLKEEIRDRFAQSIRNLEAALEDAEIARDEMQAQADEWQAEIEAIADEIADLLEQLADCERRCAAGEDINIPEDYQIGQGDWSWLDSIREFFDDLFNPDPVLVGLQELIDQLDEDGPTEPPVDPTLDDPYGVASLEEMLSSAGLPVRLCPECDPIIDQISEFTAELDRLTAERDALEAQRAQLNADWQRALTLRDNARRALDRFNNPPASGESEGRRLDSNDMAAMKVRNGRLWGEYKSGQLTAQELSDAWGKPFDDPAVRRELDAIKEKMKQELEDAAREASDAMDQIEQSLDQIGERSIELAGSIAVLETLLDHLWEQLDACEKSCMERITSLTTEEFMQLIAELEATIETSPVDKSGSSVSSEASVTDGGGKGWVCEWTGWFCGTKDYSSSRFFDYWVGREDSSASSSSSQSSAQTDVVSSSAKSSSSRTATGVQSSSEKTSSSTATTGGQSSLKTSSSSAKSAAQAACTGGTSLRDACEESCDGVCVSAGAGNGGVACYTCREEAEEVTEQSCDDVCRQQGFQPGSTDYSDAILAQLQGYTCVSGASVSIQAATIGDCSCIGEYSLSVNQAVPVCSGTPCGDVQCGSSTSCQTAPDTTTTVSCNWKGWQKVDKNQFRPVIGQ